MNLKLVVIKNNHNNIIYSIISVNGHRMQIWKIEIGSDQKKKKNQQNIHIAKMKFILHYTSF